MITIQEIADRAGVSRRTVDRVLKQRGKVKLETKEKIQKILDELDYHPNIAAQGLAARKKKYKIGFCSVEGRISPIHEEIRRGALNQAKKLEEYGFSLEMYLFKYNEILTPDAIKKMIDGFDCDALAVAPGNVSGVEELLQHAEALGIPIVFYNLDDTRYKRMCYVGCDYFQSGRLAAGLVNLCLRGKGSVGVYTSIVSNAYSYEERLRGFQEELRMRYPDIHMVEKVFLNDNQMEYEAAVRATSEKYPDLDVIYLVNPGDYSICETVGRVFQNHKVRIITNDLLEIQKEMLKNETISATVSQDPVRQGEWAVDILFQYLAFGIVPAERNYTDLIIHIGQSE